MNTKKEEAYTLIKAKYYDILKATEFETTSANFKTVFQDLLDNDVNSTSENYAAQLKIKEDQKNNIKVAFEYINSNDEKINLASFKGKYIYIDLWATTCGPCLVQFPYLEKIKEKYNGKNIEFVSISVDKSAYKWKKYLEKHPFGGVNLYCSNQKDEFMTKINLDGIPRMLLIDPQGNIIDYSAKLPSDPELINDIDKLLAK